LWWWFARRGKEGDDGPERQSSLHVLTEEEGRGLLPKVMVEPMGEQRGSRLRHDGVWLGGMVVRWKGVQSAMEASSGGHRWSLGADREGDGLLRERWRGRQRGGATGSGEVKYPWWLRRRGEQGVSI